MARRGQLVPGPQGQARGREQSPAQGQARGQALVPARARTPGRAQAQDAVPAPGIQQSQGREVGAKGHTLWGASSLWGDKSRLEGVPDFIPLPLGPQAARLRGNCDEKRMRKMGRGSRAAASRGGREGPHTASPSTFPEDASDTGLPSPWGG